ncbi:MAG: hypothetical protein IT337_09275 [Thermomicrobiales bacterium]|nr:hypothetical protein [Thermomicrobiales bacterium]
MLIVVPGTPDADLSLNGRVHWAKRSRLTKQLRGTARRAAEGVIGCGLVDPVFDGPVRVRSVIAWEPYRKTVDGDNASGLLKPIMDGFSDANLWRDDRQCVFEPIEQQRDPDKRGYVAVLVMRGDAILAGDDGAPRDERGAR